MLAWVIVTKIFVVLCYHLTPGDIALMLFAMRARHFGGVLSHQMEVFKCVEL